MTPSTETDEGGSVRLHDEGRTSGGYSGQKEDWTVREEVSPLGRMNYNLAPHNTVS